MSQDAWGALKGGRQTSEHSPDGEFRDDDAVLVEGIAHKVAEPVIVVQVGDGRELADLFERLEVQVVDVRDPGMGRDAERELLQVPEAMGETGRQLSAELQRVGVSYRGRVTPASTCEGRGGGRRTKFPPLRSLSASSRSPLFLPALPKLIMCLRLIGVEDFAA